MHSIVLTVHNKEWLIDKVIEGIILNTTEPYELIVVIDGCTDNSEKVIWDTLSGTPVDRKFIYAPDVFETTANNLGMKIAKGDKIIIVQDDMIIKEKGWNVRMEKPFKAFDDVFAVTSRTAHNWVFNTNTQHLGMEEDLDTCWCDIVDHVDHADRKQGLPRDVFAVRCSVNRGPLMIDHEDLKKLNYLDEAFAPQDMDDHDLCYRAYKELGKVVGAYWIDYESEDSWGGTRVETGSPASWLLKAHHKNTKIFYDRHKDLINTRRIIENRELV
jgi:glycosyltransferase involved in cell wall biosynthesis